MNAKTIGGIQYLYPSNLLEEGSVCFFCWPAVEKEHGERPIQTSQSCFLQLLNPTKSSPKVNALLQYSSKHTSPQLI
jgi:hypothetical protein